MLQGIAKKWGLPIKAINEEIDARAEFMERVAATPWALEASGYARCINVYRVICDRNRREHGSLRHQEAALAWEQWLKEENSCGN